MDYTVPLELVEWAVTQLVQVRCKYFWSFMQIFFVSRAADQSGAGARAAAVLAAQLGGAADPRHLGEAAAGQRAAPPPPPQRARALPPRGRGSQLPGPDMIVDCQSVNDNSPGQHIGL